MCYEEPHGLDSVAQTFATKTLIIRTFFLLKGTVSRQIAFTADDIYSEMLQRM